MPGQTRRSAHRGGARRAAFNGGPGTCPAKRDEVSDYLGHVAVPSMEGRARARPNPYRGFSAETDELILQWRAGHVPGQTARLIWWV